MHWLGGCSCLPVFYANSGCICICWIAPKLPLRDLGLELRPVGFVGAKVFFNREESFFGWGPTGAGYPKKLLNHCQFIRTHLTSDCILCAF